jgi:PAT family beta-lactamase induction signal transducer AmpG
MTSPRNISRGELSFAVGLYALQGVVVAYLLNYNKSYMIAGGIEERLAGRVETAVLLTLVLKFLLGPLSDRFSPFNLGHRIPFILLGLVVQSIGLVGLACLPPGSNLIGFTIMAYLAVIGLSLYDTCCDGFVVDITPPEDRSRVQGALQVSRFLATMLCTWGFGKWMGQTGIGPGHSEGVLYTCALLAVPLLLLGLFIKERETHTSPEEQFRWAALKELGKPHALVLLAFGALYAMIGLGVEFNLSRYYVHLGGSQDDVGTYSAIRYGGRALGAILLPILRSRLGRRGQLVVGLLALSATTAGQGLVGSSLSTGAWAFVFGMANGWNDALFCVMAMEAADPRMAASTFAIFMAVSNLSVLGDALFLEAVHLLNGNYQRVLWISSLLLLALLTLVPALTRTSSPRLATAHDS